MVGARQGGREGTEISMINEKYVSFSGQGILGEAQLCYRYEDQGLVLAQLSREQAESFLNQPEVSGKGVWNEKWLQEKRELMRQMDCHFLLLVWREHEEKCLLFLSDTKRVRPLEFLDYLIPGFGLVRGDDSCASGRVSSVILKLRMSSKGQEKSIDYLMGMIVSYFEECDWIDAAKYGTLHAEEICRMKHYYKKKVAWACVRTMDVAERGTSLKIKSLENESGLIVVASEDTYIMIGCRGEVYDIDREKFEKTYELTEEPLDVFKQLMEFFPELERLPEQKYITIDEYAHLCYPKKGSGIYARKLEKRTKVFPARGAQEYFLGRPGDYLAIRTDDLTDMYVIQADIFPQTYSAE